MKIREPAVSGMFYPNSKAELSQMIDSLMQKCVKKKLDNVKAMIVPHAGYSYSGIVAASGYSLIKEKPHNMVIIMGPSHRIPFLGGAFDTNEFWITPLGKVKVNNFYAEKIKLLPEAHIHEHSIEVQVPFLQKTLRDFSICPISLGFYAGSITNDILKNISDNTLIIVSSDLSHYLPYADAVKTDNATIKSILSLEHVNADDACGAEGINILVDIAKIKKWKPLLVDYKNSGDTSGAKSEVVGYCCIAFIE